MCVAISPVNPLEDKFLIVITSTMNQNYRYVIEVKIWIEKLTRI